MAPPEYLVDMDLSYGFWKGRWQRSLLRVTLSTAVPFHVRSQWMTACTEVVYALVHGECCVGAAASLKDGEAEMTELADLGEVKEADFAGPPRQRARFVVPQQHKKERLKRLLGNPKFMGSTLWFMFWNKEGTDNKKLPRQLPERILLHIEALAKAAKEDDFAKAAGGDQQRIVANNKPALKMEPGLYQGLGDTFACLVGIVEAKVVPLAGNVASTSRPPPPISYGAQKSMPSPSKNASPDDLEPKIPTGNRLVLFNLEMLSPTLDVAAIVALVLRQVSNRGFSICLHGEKLREIKDNLPLRELVE